MGFARFDEYRPPDPWQEEGYEEEDAPEDKFEALDELYYETVNAIDALEEEGQLSPGEAAESRKVTRQQYREVLAELEGDYSDDDEEGYYDEDDEEHYASGGALAEFRSGNDFGKALLAICDEYEDPVDGIVELARTTGHDPEDIVGLISGEYVPDPALAHQIASAYGLDEGEDGLYEEFMGLGADAYEQGVGEKWDLGDEDDEEEGEEEENYSHHLQNLEFRNQELEARFAEMEVQQEVASALQDLERIGAKGIQEGWLPPVAFREMFGNFETVGDQVAAFSATCDGDGVDLETKLYAMEFAMGCFERCGPFVNFAQMVDEPLSNEEIEIEEEEEAQARRDASEFLQRTRRLPE